MTDGKKVGATQRAKRGFQLLPAERMREIASRGGKKAHSNGTAHRYTTEEAQRAGAIGGRRVSRDRAHMAEIGRKGGLARQANRRSSAAEHASSDGGQRS